MAASPKGTSKPGGGAVSTISRNTSASVPRASIGRGTAPTPVRAHMATSPMVRTVKYYPVLEEELDNLGTRSRYSSLFLSLASGSLGIGLTLFLAKETIPEATLSNDTSHLGYVLMVYGPWLFLPLCALFTLMGGISLIAQHTKVSKIKASATDAVITART